MAGWWQRWFGWLFGRPKPAPGFGIPAPKTLVAKVRSAQNDDRRMVRVAEESLRRGFSDQAELLYDRAAEVYRAHGHHRKAIAVLRALTRLRPSDPEVFVKLAEALEALDRRIDAGQALREAAERFDGHDAPEQAQAMRQRAREFELRPDEAFMPPESAPRSAGPPALEPQSDGPPVFDSAAFGPPAFGSPSDGPSPSVDVSEEEVKSLVMEALELPGLEDEADPHHRELDDVDPTNPSLPTPQAPLPILVLDETDDTTDDLEPPPEVPRPQVSIPSASTVYDPRGSAAMTGDFPEPVVGSSVEADRSTRVAADVEVKSLLERLRKNKKRG